MAITTHQQVRPSVVYRRLMERLPIRMPNRQIVPLRFNTAQEYLWRRIAPMIDRQERIWMIILKARRLGMSTLIEALLTATCVLQDYVQAMVVAHEKKATQRIWSMSERFVHDSALKNVGQVKGHQISFRHSILELATAGSPNASRSADLTCFHGSEVAFWKDANAMLATLQCLPRDEHTFSIAAIESTANGMADDGEMFYSQWERASNGESSFIPIFLPWHTFPQYTARLNTPIDHLTTDEEMLIKDLGLTFGQIRWRRRVLADECEGDEDKFNQEYPATPEMAFIMSGLPFFRSTDLVWLEPYIISGERGKLEMVHLQTRFITEGKGRLTIFQHPQAGHQYVIGADSSMGIADTEKKEHSRSAAEIIDMETLEQVAEYDAASAPHIFARDLALMGRYYNTALIAPEVQSSGGGGGREVIVYLRDNFNYANLHRWQHPDRIRRGGATLYGWETNSRTRPRMLARLREVMMERSAIIHSRALITQLRCFGENDSDKMEALSGHDDLLFAYGIALMSRSENYVAKRVVKPNPLQLPFQAAQLPWQEDYQDHERSVLGQVLGGQPGIDMPASLDFLSW